MLPLSKYLILFFFFFSNCYAQVIDKINITTTGSFSQSSLLSWGGVNSGTKYYPGVTDTIQTNIARHLTYQGYLNPIFNSNISLSEDSQKVSIQINVDEGEPTYIQKINFIDKDSLLNEDIISSFMFLEGQIINKIDIEETIAQTPDYYENNGFPFASVKIISINYIIDSSDQDHYADINIEILKGNKSTIDKVVITGNTDTKDYVIVRELRIEAGEIYSQKKVDELPRRLNRLRFFDPVGPPQFLLNSQKQGVLLINVKEKQTNNFDGIIGYIPGAKEGEKGYLTGLVNVSLRNLFGTGRAAAIRWQQFNRYSQELELKYLEPWLLGYPFNVSGSAFQRKQDTIYVQRRFEGSLEYLATEDITAAVSVGNEQIIPTISETPRFTVYHSSSITTGVNIKVDTRDDPYAPREGLLFINAYLFSRKKIFGPSEFINAATKTNINLQRISVSFGAYFEFFTRQVIAVSLHWRELKGAFFENSDLFRLGGTNTLRGYREDQFLGSRIGWTNFEYRFLMSRRTYAFTFFDTGYYLRNADESRSILKQEGFKIGYGVGLNLETGLGVLGVSFALAKGDGFSDGKIHFGLVNEF
ncbi:MAG: BamA/TamA family outer membrane protein [Ignavibacteriaceae bacterium]|nr:BamA/TamA family outer membrane protein [Ignavibacteriaceae bacterium]